MKNNQSPDSKNKKRGRWSKSETDHLLLILKEGVSSGKFVTPNKKIKWSIVSCYISQRDKDACKARFKCLKNNHDPRIQEILKELNDYKKPYEKNINFTKALTKKQEDDLYNKIIKRL